MDKRSDANYEENGDEQCTAQEYEIMKVSETNEKLIVPGGKLTKIILSW